MKYRIANWALVGLVVGLLLLLWLVTEPNPVAAAPLLQEGEPVIHVVQSGETLFRIAQRYGTTVDAIVAANDIADPRYIYVGQELVIPGTTAEVPTTGEEPASEDSPPAEPPLELASYLVVPADTLDAVARRFGTTAPALAELNGVANPTSLPAGGWLQVPAGTAHRVHRVAENETAVGLALRYGVPLWEFLATNGLRSVPALIPGRPVWIPDPVTGTVTSTLPLPFLALDVGPLPVLQGNTVRVRADLLPSATVRGVFADEVLRFATEGQSHYALFGVHALADPGEYTLALLASDAAGDETYLTRSVTVAAGDYGYEEIVLGADRDAVLDPEALAAERARLAEIKPVFNPERYWDGLFTRPISTGLTSVFGTRRMYQSPSYQSYGYHEGTDFKGNVGDPVYAPAPGVVVLAEQLFVRGGAVVIDHGWGVYTGYWHLSEIGVTVGQRVATGDPIARVGHTGLSTGAHLHWDFWVNGTNVRALQWTEHAFP